MVSIQSLNYFLKICETGSLSQAAEQLFVSQPTLSLALKNLEKDLGVRLFSRSNRGMEITAEGRRLQGYCRQLMQQLSLIENMADDPPQSRLVVESSPFLVFPEVLIEMRRRYKDLEIHFRESRVEPILDHVEWGATEIGVIQHNNLETSAMKKKLYEKNLEMEVLSECSWALAVGPHNPLYGCDQVTMEQVIPYRVLRRVDDYFSSLTGSQKIGGVWLNDLNCDFLEADTIAGWLLQETDQVAFARMKEPYLKEYQVRLIPIADADIRITVGWVRKKAFLPGPEAEEFLGLLRQAWA